MTCKQFGWYNNGTVNMACDKKALDIHATLALMWLFFFTIQAMAIRFGFKKFHMIAGLYYFFPVAMINVFGMAIITGSEIGNAKSTRPREFYPFMILTMILIIFCLFKSFLALFPQSAGFERSVDNHTLWIVRAFLVSFTTPVMRLYPIAMRMLFSTACVRQQESLEVFLIASMTVSIVVTTYFAWLQNKAVLENPFDPWFKAVLLIFGFGFLVDIIQTVNKGYFFYHMIKCYRASDEDTVDFALVFGILGGLCILIFLVDYVRQRYQYNQKILSLESEGEESEASWEDNEGKDYKGHRVIDLSNGEENKKDKTRKDIPERLDASNGGTEKDSSSKSVDEASSESDSTTTPPAEINSFVAPTEYTGYSQPFKPARAPIESTKDGHDGLRNRSKNTGFRDGDKNYY